MRFLAVLVLVLAGVHAPATGASAREDTQMARRTALEAAVVRGINDVRAARGLHPLRSAPALRTAARTHSRSMLDLGFFAHESPDGTAFSDRIRRFYSDRGWRTWSVGEALLSSQARQIDAAAVVSAWLGSPAHREILLSPTWRDVGIGAFYAASAPRQYGASETVVLTADFGLRSGKTN